MGRLSGFGGREVQRVAESQGWRFNRSSGDHFVYRKVGNRFNLSIPGHRSLDEGTLRQILKTMGLTVDEFLKLASK